MKKTSVVAKIESAWTRRKKKSGLGLRRSERSTKQAEKPVSGRSAKKTQNVKDASRKTWIEAVEGDTKGAAQEAGHQNASDHEIEAAGTEAGEGVEAGAEPGHASGQDLQRSLKTSRWMMNWHYSCCCRKASRSRSLDSDQSLSGPSRSNLPCAARRSLPHSSSQETQSLLDWPSSMANLSHQPFDRRAKNPPRLLPTKTHLWKTRRQ